MAELFGESGPKCFWRRWLFGGVALVQGKHSHVVQHEGNGVRVCVGVVKVFALADESFYV